VCFVPSLALVEFVALTLSEAAVTSAGGGGDGAVEDCDEADIEDPGSRAVVKSVRKVVRSFDNWLRSAARPDVDDDDDADDELAEEVDDDDEDDSSSERRLVRSVSSVESRLLTLEDEAEEVEDVEEDGGGPGGGPPTPPGPSPWPPGPLLPSCKRKASAAAESPTELDASIDDAELEVDVDELVVALDWLDALFWLARLACNNLSSRLCSLPPYTERLMIDSPGNQIYSWESKVKKALMGIPRA
jgi:hypothetical protein